MCAQKLNTQTRQEQIINCAFDIVHKEGLSSITIEKIAQNIGIVPSAIYRHFKNKEQIIDALLNKINKTLIFNIEEAKSLIKDPLEILEHILTNQIHILHKVSSVFPRIMLSDQVLSGNIERKQLVNTTFESYLCKIGDIITQGQQTGSIRKDISADSIAVMFLGLFQPSAFLFLIKEGNFDIVKYSKDSWVLFVSSIKLNTVKEVS